MAKVITFGEIMLRLAPEAYFRIVQADKFSVTYSGAEANVAVSLANFGVDTAFVTKLPDNEPGQSAINYMRRFGVNTDMIVRGGERIGIYFLEKGASQRASKVIYDRKNSSIATASASDFDWNTIFEGAEIFHFTGITPALSDELAEICYEACKAAKEKDIIITCDLNFRKKLWSSEKAGKVMSRLCQFVDICIANEEDASTVFGITAPQESFNKLNRDGYVKIAAQLAERFSFKKVAITLRDSISASVNNWSGLLYVNSEKKAYFSREYNIQIVDRVGAGDSFTAGLIFSELNDFDSDKAVNFAAAASCLKHSIEGDFNMVSKEEVLSLMNGNDSGRVQR